MLRDSWRHSTGTGVSHMTDLDQQFVTHVFAAARHELPGRSCACTMTRQTSRD
jgi:hypothetical protein